MGRRLEKNRYKLHGFRECGAQGAGGVLRLTREVLYPHNGPLEFMAGLETNSRPCIPEYGISGHLDLVLLIANWNRSTLCKAFVFIKFFLESNSEKHMFKKIVGFGGG